MSSFLFLAVTFLLSLKISYVISAECIDRSGTATSGDITLNLQTICVDQTVIVNITNSAYNNKWFGIVFNNQMIGNALVYTTGKPATETQRAEGLYPYTLSNQSANGVLYDGQNNDWNEISTDDVNGVINIIYSQNIASTPIISNISSNTSSFSIQFMRAGGADISDLHLTYHRTNRADQAVTINVEPVVPTINITMNITTTTTTIQPDAECARYGIIPLEVCYNNDINMNGSIRSSQKIRCDEEGRFYTDEYEGGSCQGPIIKVIDHGLADNNNTICNENGCVCTPGGGGCDYAVGKIYVPQIVVNVTIINDTTTSECGRFGDQPLDICYESVINGNVTSTELVCNDEGQYVQFTYDDDSCNGSIINRIPRNCPQGVDCVCSSGEYCNYAIIRNYNVVINGTTTATPINDTTQCNGTNYIEQGYVLNECVTASNNIGYQYECSDNNELRKSYAQCGGVGNTSDLVPAQCNLQCFELNISTTTAAPVNDTKCSGDYGEIAVVLNECVPASTNDTSPVQITCSQELDGDKLIVETCNNNSLNDVSVSDIFKSITNGLLQCQEVNCYENGTAPTTTIQPNTTSIDTTIIPTDTTTIAPSTKCGRYGSSPLDVCTKIVNGTTNASTKTVCDENGIYWMYLYDNGECNDPAIKQIQRQCQDEGIQCVCAPKGEDCEYAISKDYFDYFDYDDFITTEEAECIGDSYREEAFVINSCLPSIVLDDYNDDNIVPFTAQILCSPDNTNELILELCDFNVSNNNITLEPIEVCDVQCITTETTTTLGPESTTTLTPGPESTLGPESTSTMAPSPECFDKYGDNEDDEFIIGFYINCTAETVIINITYKGYDGNWFGIVFNNSMIGNAVIYTKGKVGEIESDTVALYGYSLTGWDIEAVNYDVMNGDWRKISEGKINGAANVEYEQDLDKTEFSLETQNIPIRWAFGPKISGLELTYHHTGRAVESLQLELTDVITPTIAPTIGPEPIPKDDNTSGIIIGSAIGAFFAICLIIICALLIIDHQKHKKAAGDDGGVTGKRGDYDAVDTDMDTDVEMQTR